jgi:hypothetical protein
MRPGLRGMLLELHRRDVVAGTLQPAVIPPVDPGQCGQLQIARYWTPRPTPSCWAIRLHDDLAVTVPTLRLLDHPDRPDPRSSGDNGWEVCLLTAIAPSSPNDWSLHQTRGGSVQAARTETFGSYVDRGRRCGGG